MNDLIDRESAIVRATKVIKDDGVAHDVMEVLRDMPSANQWIPCSERLPEKGLHVLMQFKNARQTVGWYDKEKMQWYVFPFNLEVVNNHVLAWMPLPQYEDTDD